MPAERHAALAAALMLPLAASQDVMMMNMMEEPMMTAFGFDEPMMTAFGGEEMMMNTMAGEEMMFAMGGDAEMMGGSGEAFGSGASFPSEEPTDEPTDEPAPSGPDSEIDESSGEAADAVRTFQDLQPFVTYCASQSEHVGSVHAWTLAEIGRGVGKGEQWPPGPTQKMGKAYMGEKFSGKEWAECTSRFGVVETINRAMLQYCNVLCSKKGCHCEEIGKYARGELIINEEFHVAPVEGPGPVATPKPTDPPADGARAEMVAAKRLNNKSWLEAGNSMFNTCLQFYSAPKLSGTNTADFLAVKNNKLVTVADVWQNAFGAAPVTGDLPGCLIGSGVIDYFNTYKYNLCEIRCDENATTDAGAALCYNNCPLVDGSLAPAPTAAPITPKPTQPPVDPVLPPATSAGQWFAGRTGAIDRACTGHPEGAATPAQCCTNSPAIFGIGDRGQEADFDDNQSKCTRLDAASFQSAECTGPYKASFSTCSSSDCASCEEGVEAEAGVCTYMGSEAGSEWFFFMDVNQCSTFVPPVVERGLSTKTVRNARQCETCFQRVDDWCLSDWDLVCQGRLDNLVYDENMQNTSGEIYVHRANCKYLCQGDLEDRCGACLAQHDDWCAVMGTWDGACMDMATAKCRAECAGSAYLLQ